MNKPNKNDLAHRFFFQPPPNQERVRAHEKVSTLCFDLAIALNILCPPGRNHSLMLTHLEDVRMRANAALACDSPLVVVQTCRKCGCTEDQACISQGVPCHWVEADLCSTCASAPSVTGEADE